MAPKIEVAPVRGKMANFRLRTPLWFVQFPGLSRERRMQAISVRSARFRHVVFSESPRRRRTGDRFVHAHRPHAAHADSNDEHLFLAAIFESAGIDLRAYRGESLHRRLAACLRVLRAGSAAEGMRILIERPEKLRDALEAMLIGVTGFFRDRAVFEALAQVHLPVMVRDRPPRIWSVGCSDGAELYSIAMLMAGFNGDGCDAGGADLLGTDVRPAAIARARLGVFDRRLVSELPGERIDRHLLPHGNRWAVKPELSAAARWRVGDALKTIEPGAWDMILCRNFAMYLDAARAGELWRALENALRPGGLLVLGKAERPLGAKYLSLAGPCIYRRDRG